VDDITVPAEEGLILAPGVTFEFEEGAFTQYSFDVNGILAANGMDTNPVIFRAVDVVVTTIILKSHRVLLFFHTAS